MATSAVQNPVPVTGESKSAKKKKARAEAGAANGGASTPDVSTDVGKEESIHQDGDSTEHPYLRELGKHIRNINKKLAGMQKVDAVIAENPNTSLDDLVAAKKINTDQKASVLKRPQLQAQVTQFEEQITQYRKFEADHQGQLHQQREVLTAQHQKELERVREDAKFEGTSNNAAELRKKLLVLSQFLRCAAAKRAVEDDAETDESRAFEGALLLVYGGDDKAVDAAINLIEGSAESVPGIDGTVLPVKYSQIKQASIDHGPFQTEESWVDSVAEANASLSDAKGAEAISDPTLLHAGLTELSASAPSNGVLGSETTIAPLQTDAGDLGGDKWDTATSGAEKESDEGFEMIPRPADEVETAAPVIGAAPSTASTTQEKTSWADDVHAQEVAARGNHGLGQSETKIASDQTYDGGADDVAASTSQEDDGFHQVAGRHRGRGGRGRGGDGEFRGRGRGRGGFRGDGEFRGRGRGGFRGGRGGEGAGDFRGRGRGRGGPRGAGGAEGQPRGS